MGKVEKLNKAQLPGGSSHPVHQTPCPHICREIERPLQGWSPVHQPEPSPRLELTPYIGCVAGCDFCFLNGYPGLYRLGQEDKLITVYKNYPLHLKETLQKLRVAPPAILSPYTDPFQPINDRYGLAEELIKECVLVNLPLEVITRYHIPDEILAMMEYLPAGRVQVSIDPFEREGPVPHYRERLEFMERIDQLGLDVVVRLDPVFPGEENTEGVLVNMAKEIDRRNLDQVVIGFGRANSNLHSRFVEPKPELFEEHPDRDNCWILSENARRRLAELAANIFDSQGIKIGFLAYPRLQDEYGDFKTPFKNNLPLSQREGAGEKFRPVEGCPGNCRICSEPACGIDYLFDNPFRGERLKAGDWEKWSKQRLQGELLN
ncbi:MAG: hypothetical protein ACQEP7_07255 [bacterium]